LNTALWLRPDSPTPLSELAWMLATCPQADLRDGRRAVELAERALKLSDDPLAASWAALDAAYAETGRFEEAIQAAEKTRQLALTTGQKEVAQAAETRLAIYRNHQPFRQ